MHTENAALNNSSKREIIKGFYNILPNITITVLSLTLIIKPVLLSRGSAFMVPPKEGDPIRILALQRKQQLNRLHRVTAPVHKISDKYITLLW